MQTQPPANVMNMPGMPTGHGVATHMLNLLPLWMGVAWTAAFLAVAASHLRHMAATTGQRRPWHSCHVLMAVGMAFMYAPAQIDPLAVPIRILEARIRSRRSDSRRLGDRRGRPRLDADLAADLDRHGRNALHVVRPATAGHSPADMAAHRLPARRSESCGHSISTDGSMDATPIVSWRLLASESGATMSTSLDRHRSCSLRIVARRARHQRVDDRNGCSVWPTCSWPCS